MIQQMEELHAIVKGKVQGVGFRATTQYYAKKRGLSGVVRNLPDGSVEIYAIGDHPNLEGLVADLKNDRGLGKVESIATDFNKPMRHYSDFQIVF